MKLLLTNDDGYEAAGLQELASILSRDHECWIVAPDSGMSCCSHSVTNANPISLKKQGERGWTVSGTPADCVRLGLLVLKLQPDWILSGVNHGGNLGIDTLFSGTVAGAREGRLLGFPSIAISQYMRRDIAKDWGQTAFRAKRLLDYLWTRELRPACFWNVNLPAIEPEPIVGEHVFPISHCALEESPLSISYELSSTGIDEGESEHIYQSNYQQRPRRSGTDVDLCFSGHSTITELRAFGG